MVQCLKLPTNLLFSALLMAPAAMAQDIDLPVFDANYGPWGMKGYGTKTIEALPRILEADGTTKAAFTIFATEIEVLAPAATVAAYKNLRDLDGFPIHGIWIETQHIRSSPSEVKPLVALANAEGFYTIVRVPTHSRTDIQGYIGTGAKGLVIPVTENVEQIQSALENSFYSAWREMGFEPDTTNLRRIGAADLQRVDDARTLFFMVESFAAVENLGLMIERATELCEKYKVKKTQVGFWLGPYDAKVNWRRIEQGDAAAADQWWNTELPKIAQAVSDAGFIMGGHMGNLSAGIDLVKRGFKIFTIAGAGDSIGNPKVPSTPALFESATPEQRKQFLNIPSSDGP